MKSLRNIIQAIVVKTSFPPFTFLYKTFYALSIKLAVSMLRKVKGVEAIYLIRGAAKNEIVYGLSDVDLWVILDDKEDLEPLREKVLAVRRKVSRVTPIFDLLRQRELCSASGLIRLHREIPFYRYRLSESKRSWKLLFGKDVMRSLPDLSDRELYIPATRELKTWWYFLSAEFSTRRALPQFKRKYVWYKAIAEAAKTYLFVCHGEKVHDREDALDRVRAHLPEEQKPHIDKIKRYRKRLASREPVIVNDLMALFMDLARHTFSRMEKEVYTCVASRKAVLAIPDHDDLIIDRRAADTIEEVEDYVQRRLEPYLTRTVLVPQTYFGSYARRVSDIDSMHIVLVLRKYIPVEKLRHLFALCEKNCSPQRVELLIQAGDLAFSLRPQHGRGRQRTAIRNPGKYPLFHSLLAHAPLGIIKNYGKQETFQSDLSPDFDDCIRARVKKMGEMTLSRDINKPMPLSFLRFFWSAARTLIHSHLLEDECIEIPLTGRQICETASRFFPEDARWLGDLHAAYIKKLRGEESQAHRFRAKAVDFLRRI